ncbi:hypothetical protein [Pseudomonas frederiksbergensis]|uniref:hypothetical protein n=1 Tax=Pseudomonas frederiksbergensis TaxID=104087 RepID=UPI003D1D7788
MPISDLLPSLLLKINEHQLALEAALLELSNRVEPHHPICSGFQNFDTCEGRLFTRLIQRTHRP